MKLFLNIDDTEPSSKFYVCDSCFKFTTFQNLNCTCGKPTNRQPRDLDAQNQAFLRENGSTFLVFDDLKIVQSSAMTTLSLLKELGYSDLTQLEEITHNIDKQEVIVSYICIYLTIPLPSITLLILFVYDLRKI